jgi:hypothetical protein
MTSRSAFFPTAMEPSCLSHRATEAAPDVAIVTTSWSLSPSPSASDAARAALSSPRRFLLPDGDQSEPRAIRMPRALASLILVVSP